MAHRRRTLERLGGWLSDHSSELVGLVGTAGFAVRPLVDKGVWHPFGAHAGDVSKSAVIFSGSLLCAAIGAIGVGRRRASVIKLEDANAALEAQLESVTGVLFFLLEQQL